MQYPRATSASLAAKPTIRTKSSFTTISNTLIHSRDGALTTKQPAYDNSFDQKEASQTSGGQLPLSPESYYLAQEYVHVITQRSPVVCTADVRMATTSSAKQYNALFSQTTVCTTANSHRAQHEKQTTTCKGCIILPCSSQMSWQFDPPGCLNRTQGG